MVDNFKCKANNGGYCKQWLRDCVGWEHCNLKSYGAPCPGCHASSPLTHKQCEDCNYKKWKHDNYID